jgi:hypothetical protein
MRDPLWMNGDDPDSCDECGYEHDEDSDCPEEDPDSLHDMMREEW